MSAKLPGSSCTEQQDAFARYVVKYGKQTTAYIKAYQPDLKRWTRQSLWEEASHVMATPSVRARVEHYRAIARKKWSVDIEKIGEQLAKMALVDKRDIYDDNGAILPPHLWPEHIAKSVAGMEVFEERDADGVLIGHTRKIRFESRNAALAILAKWKGMLIDRVEVGTPGEFDHLSDVELDAKLSAEEQMLRAIESARKGPVKPAAKKANKERS